MRSSRPLSGSDSSLDSRDRDRDREGDRDKHGADRKKESSECSTSTSASTSGVVVSGTSCAPQRRPSSAGGGRALAAVNSMEHASLVIRSLRSFSHAQKCYHRQACTDDKIISTLRQFDQIVVQKASEVEKVQQVNNLIADTRLSGKDSVSETVKSPPPVVPGNDSDCIISSDEDDDDNEIVFSSAAKKSGKSLPKRGPSSSKNFQEHPEPSMTSTEEAMNVGHSQFLNGDQDSDDDWLLDDNDSEEMEALMKGFVGPSISAAVTRTSKKGNVSAVHDLEEEMDSSPSLPVEAPQQHKIAKVQNSKKHETMSSQHRTRSAGSTSRTSTTSEGFPPATDSSTSGRKPKRRSNSSSKGTPFTTSNSDDVKFSSTLGSQSSNNGASVSNKQHNVLITPGQRIRVRPSRKKNNNNI